VTRAEPGASSTAERVRALGLDPLVSPVLQVRPLDATIDLGGVTALAFTSGNAVRAFAAREPNRRLPLFAVGGSTAEAARDAGFTTVESADGDVADLARRLAAARPTLVLNPTAAEPSADLTGLLAAQGVAARAVALYETVPVEPTEALRALDSVAVVLVHSPKAGRRLVELLDADAIARLGFACISEAAARPLVAAGSGKAHLAPFPTEAALLKLLDRSLP
jgi:uroporphyrinogen-III synthase